jgi:ditrans,polycis-polyprenyl diphosphate synthase
MTTRLRKWLISSPPAEWALNQIRELLIGALRQGPIPRHVAFVMDGNRRYARSHRIETVEGHNLGFEALARVGFKAEWAINHEADTFVCLDP